MYVSVIIPTYNRASTIGRSIESVLNQTYDKLEVIVIDDGSADDTAEIVGSIKDERLRYIRLEANGGVARARNLGVDYAKYDMIAFHDSDDAWRPDKLEKQIKKYEEYPDSSLVYCSYVLHNGGRDMKVPDEDDIEILDGDICCYLLQRSMVGAPTILMKKDLFERLGGFNPELPALEDWDFSIKAAKAGRISYVDEVLMDAYRCDAGVGASHKNHYKARCMVIAEYMDDLQRFGIFDKVVNDMFSGLENPEALEYVKNRLILSIAEKKGINQVQ